MKRSWVLADGEVKSKKVASSSAGGCVPSSNKVTSTTNLSAIMPSSSSSNTNIMCSILSPQDEGKIRNCIEKMQLIYFIIFLSLSYLFSIPKRQNNGNKDVY